MNAAGTLSTLLVRNHYCCHEASAAEFIRHYKVEINGVEACSVQRILYRGDVVTVHFDGVHTYPIK